MLDTSLEDTKLLQVNHEKTNVSLHTVLRIANFRLIWNDYMFLWCQELEREEYYWASEHVCGGMAVTVNLTVLT